MGRHGPVRPTPREKMTTAPDPGAVVPFTTLFAHNIPIARPAAAAIVLPTTWRVHNVPIALQRATIGTFAPGGGAIRISVPPKVTKRVGRPGAEGGR